MANVIGERISGLVFYFALIAVIATVILINVTNYDSMSSTITSLVKEQKMAPANYTESDFPQTKQDWMDDCSKSSSGSIVVELEDNKSVTLDCINISKMQGSGDLFALVAVSGFKDIYYKQYDCSFISCFFNAGTNAEKIDFLISQKANDSYKILYWAVIGIAVVSGIAVIAISGNLLKAARTIGWSFATIGIGFVFTLLFKGYSIPLTAPGSNVAVTLPLFANVIGLIQVYFIVYLIVGALLLAIGYLGSLLIKKVPNKKKKD